jgi:hypothetical protein
LKPKLLFIDIETAPILMTSWSMRSPQASAVWVERDTFILMFSYKWAHEKSVKTVCLPDFPRYKRNKFDDKDLCGVLHSLLDEAEIVCAHNGDAFDIKKINSRLIVNKFGKPSPFKTIDTLKIAPSRVQVRQRSWIISGDISGKGARSPIPGLRYGAAASRVIPSPGARWRHTPSRTRYFWSASTAA